VIAAERYCLRFESHRFPTGDIWSAVAARPTTGFSSLMIGTGPCPDFTVTRNCAGPRHSTSIPLRSPGRDQLGCAEGHLRRPGRTRDTAWPEPQRRRRLERAGPGRRRAGVPPQRVVHRALPRVNAQRPARPPEPLGQLSVSRTDRIRDAPAPRRSRSRAATRARSARVRGTRRGRTHEPGRVRPPRRGLAQGSGGALCASSACTGSG